MFEKVEASKWRSCLGEGILAENCNKKVLGERDVRFCNPCRKVRQARATIPGVVDIELDLHVERVGKKKGHK